MVHVVGSPVNTTKLIRGVKSTAHRATRNKLLRYRYGNAANATVYQYQHMIHFILFDTRRKLDNNTMESFVIVFTTSKCGGQLGRSQTCDLNLEFKTLHFRC